jgi:hypothetical protein
MPVGTRVRDKGVYEHQSLDPRFCVEIPWCSGSTMPVTFYSTVINLGSGSVPQSHNYERVEQVKSVPDAPKAEVPALAHYRTAHPGVESQSRSVDGIRGESRPVATAQRSRITVGERRSFSIPPQSRLNRQTIDGIL